MAEGVILNHYNYQQTRTIATVWNKELVVQEGNGQWGSEL